MNLVYTGCENFYMFDNFKDVLKALGVECKMYLIDKPTKCEHILLPDDSFIFNNRFRYFTQPFKETIARICSFSPKIDVCNYKNLSKVYFSRSKWGDGDFGESDIENVFKKIGYSIIYPEKLTFFEQLYILQNCDSFASTEGSTSHNALFLREGAECIILRKADYINMYQLPINELKNLNVTYIDAHLSIYAEPNFKYVGPFFMYVNSNLQRFIWTRLKEKPFLNSFTINNFIKYTIYAYEIGLSERCVCDKFYSDRLRTEIFQEKSHKYYKLLNKLWCKKFPWKFEDYKLPTYKISVVKNDSTNI